MNDKVRFKDEKGQDVEYEILGIELYNDKVYCIFYSTDEKDTKAYIYRVETSDNEEYDNYIFETDPNITEKVFEQFKNRNKDKYKFETK